ncbi:hypothetical protein BHC49_11290 [Snodgrassella alvi]|uniref:FimV N-terminal domain-containing protein n=2 Tax=Snodgrassella alvi TaxID=1196083 RepID=A0A2N9XU17_9NEIS|nr:hypothetical protein BHC49_11290 [Snodgrassella alvi]
MLASAPAWAGLGSLQVNSALGEPFSGSVVVTGDEARAALQSRPAVSGAPLQVRVTAQGKNAVIHLRSSKPVRDPMLSFSLTAGSQGRQYTALLDPPEYRHGSAGAGKAVSNHRKPARPVKEKSAARATAALQNRLASDNAVVKYHVDNNETLMDVARKVRPQGLSIEQTMHALIVANPHAFRNGNPDFMYRDISLNIPSTSQLHKLSKIKIKAIQKPAGAVQGTAPVSAAPGVAENAVPQKSVKTDAGTGNAANTVVSEVGNAASAPTRDGKAKTETIPASAPVQASALVQASAPAASAASVVKAAPVQPKVNQVAQPVQPVEEPAEESMLPTWWPYALAGVAGVLLIAALLWQRRKKSNNAEDDEDYASDEDDDVVFDAVPPKIEQSVSVPSTSAKAAVSTAAATATATATAASSTVEDDGDWSWLNDAATDTPAKADAPAGNVNQVAATPHLADTTPAADKQEEDDTDWLNFNFADDAPAAAAVPSTAEQNNADDLSWLDQIDEPEQPEVLTSHEPAVAAPHEEVADNTDFEWVVAEEPQLDEFKAEVNQDAIQVVPQSEPAASEVDTLNDLADLQWDEDFKFDNESEQNTTPAVEVPPAVEQIPMPHEQNSSGAEDDAISTDINWETLGISDDESMAEPASPAASSTPAVKADAQEIPSMDFTLDDEAVATDNVDSATVTAPTSSFATGSGAQDWLDRSAASEPADQPLTPEQQAVPLQAKLELAKMYLEMDDAVTARQTLRELVDEANGSILAEAQNLLQQLGG